jgi:hydrogenase/urease accessory protein HupE
LPRRPTRHRWSPERCSAPATVLAADASLPDWTVALLAGLFGTLHGLLNGSALVAVRVARSWIAAVGMLMFGWLVRGTG